MSNAKSRIQQELEHQGHTYRSIGAMIGITPQAVSEIVNGRTQGATARYALAAALGGRVSDFWSNGESHVDGRSNGAGSAATPMAHRRRGARRNGRLHPADAVAVSICCPERRVPTSVRLGIDASEGDGALSVFQCEHFADGPVECAMECLT